MNKYLFLTFTLILIIECGLAQYSSAYIYLKNGKTIISTVQKITESGIIDSMGTEIFFVQVQSLLTSDSVMAYKIVELVSGLQIQKHENGYYIDISSIVSLSSINLDNRLTKKENQTSNRLNIVQDEDNRKYLKQYLTKSYPYRVLLPISLVWAGLAWDNLSDMSSINSTINVFNKLGYDISDLKSQKNRKLIIGIACIYAGVVNAIFSLTSVEVQVMQQSQSLSLVYHF